MIDDPAGGGAAFALKGAGFVNPGLVMAAMECLADGSVSRTKQKKRDSEIPKIIPPVWSVIKINMNPLNRFFDLTKNVA